MRNSFSLSIYLSILLYVFHNYFLYKSNYYNDTEIAL